MFLTESEVGVVLQQPTFALPVTESRVDYEFYRGRKKVNLLTIRFNMIPSFTESMMLAHLQHRLITSPYELQSQIVASVQYDLLLCNTETSPPTFYIWRSNTNRTTLNVDYETTLTLSYDHIKRLCDNVTHVNLSDLQANFVNSHVTVDRVLTIVFTFEQ